MPVPDHSKMISKRIRQLKSTETNQAKQQQPQPKPTLIRVICTDPDATDSSSDDDDSAPESHICFHSHQDRTYQRKKRLVREIALPKTSKSPNKHAYTVLSTQSLKPRPNQKQEDMKEDLHETRTFNTDPINSSSHNVKEHHSFHCSPKQILQQEKVVSDFVSLADGFKEKNKEEIWDNQFCAADNECFEDILDLELDSEAVSWINSLQKIV